MNPEELHDNNLLKELNNELKKNDVKLKFWYYDISPFASCDKEIIPLILNYVNKLNSDKNKIFLLSVLGVKGFDDAVPAIVNEYEFFNLNKYSQPFDEILLLELCDTIAKIESKEYIDLYIKMLTMPATTALESIIKMLDKLNVPELDGYIYNLIEKENKIPNEWIGELNEENKYWCSLNALKYIINRKDSKYYDFIKKFLQPERLKWIWFTPSKYSKTNYSNCYKKYIALAKKGLSYLEK